MGITPLDLRIPKRYNYNIPIWYIYEVIDMADYQQMYVVMFRASECAARLLEQGEVEKALMTLRVAQLQCENIYLDTTE